MHSSKRMNVGRNLQASQMHIRLITEGYDPTIGVMHDREADRGSYPAFALDQMEPLGQWSIGRSCGSSIA
jgi:hypothetical protein